MEVSIDTLVLDGVSAHDPHAFGPALQRELECLLAAEGLPVAARRYGGGVERETPRVSVEAGASAVEAEVARVVWRALDARAAPAAGGESA